MQPAPQPSKYAIVTSCGGVPTPTEITLSPIDQICAGSTGSIVPGLSSIVDFSGDSLLVRVTLGNGPRWLGLNSNGTIAYIANSDGTINSYNVSTSLETNQVATSTLLSDAAPDTLLSTANYLYVSQPGRNSVAVMNGNGSSTPSVILEVPLTDPTAPTVPQYPVNLVGNPTTQRVYAISYAASQLDGNGNCTPSGADGTVTAIETSTNAPSAVLKVGDCPVYGVMSADNRRTFILNQGSGTVTVVDSQQNQIDTNPNLTNGTIAVGQGPIWADIYNTGSILAVANSQSDTLSLINISTDSFGNDSPNFGKTIATVPVGKDPSSVAILQDGTRAYVANRGDGTVSVVNLVTNTVTKTITLPQEPCQAGQPNVLCTVHPLSIAATTGTPLGKVYVVSPDTDIMTIIRTDNDTIYENLQLTGNGIQVRVTAP